MLRPQSGLWDPRLRYPSQHSRELRALSTANSFGNLWSPKSPTSSLPGYTHPRFNTYYSYSPRPDINLHCGINIGSNSEIISILTETPVLAMDSFLEAVTNSAPTAAFRFDDTRFYNIIPWPSYSWTQSSFHTTHDIKDVLGTLVARETPMMLMTTGITLVNLKRLLVLLCSHPSAYPVLCVTCPTVTES